MCTTNVSRFMGDIIKRKTGTSTIRRIRYASRLKKSRTSRFELGFFGLLSEKIPKVVEIEFKKCHFWMENYLVAENRDTELVYTLDAPDQVVFNAFYLIKLY